MLSKKENILDKKIEMKKMAICFRRSWEERNRPIWVIIDPAR
jgi:hypothetical protein